MRGSRYLNLHEKSERDTPNTSPPHRNTLSSTPGKRTCGSTGRDCEGLTPDSSTGGDKKNSWNGQEAEAENKEEDQESYNRDGDKKTTPSLGSTKLRRPSAVEGNEQGQVMDTCRGNMPPRTIATALPVLDRAHSKMRVGMSARHAAGTLTADREVGHNG